MMDQDSESERVASIMTSDLEMKKTLSLTANVESGEQKLSQPSEADDSSVFSQKSWMAILLTCIPIALICLLVWLDESILATAIPRISDDFDSFNQIGWYGPSYLFGLCACQLPFGRAYKDFPSKITYLISLLIFEVASLVQAAAPSSEAFIIGRVLAGIGGSGVLAGSLTIFSQEIPKAKLPYVMGAFGWVHTIGSIAGPVIGGAITSSSLTWRWCFYLNPIISAGAMVPVIYLWRGNFVPDPKDVKPPLKEILAKFDYSGIIVFAAAVVALLLGLQFGGSSYLWSDRRTIASLTVAGVSFLIFAVIEWCKGNEALVPANIAGNRVVSLASIYTSTLDGAYFILTYQIPLWFQSVLDLSARDSGYRILPLLVSCILAMMAGTTLTGKLRYYHPFMLLGAVLLTVGSGVLTTLRPGASAANWIICEVLAGGGTGFGSPLPLLAVQDTLPLGDVSIGYAVVLTAGYLGSSIALAIAQAVFASQLKRKILLDLQGVDPDAIINAGATELRDEIPGGLYERGLQLFNMALTQSWYMSVALGGVSVFLVLGLKWKKMDMRDHK